MKSMKSSALIAASISGLVLSAAAFALDNATYKDAVAAAKSDYKSAVAICKDMKSEQRSSCMKDAKAEEKLALNKARDLRDEGKSMAKPPQAAPGAMRNEGSAKSLDLSAPASESGTEAKPAEAVTK